MADDNERSSENEEKRGGRKKTVIVVGGILVLEAVLLIGAMMFLGGPKNVEAADVLPEIEAEGEKIVEVLVLDDRLPNSRQGINYVYDTEIWVHVKQKHEEDVTEELNQYRNELKAEIMAIWRTADPRELQEPRMESITRKVQAMLSQRFGDDPESSEPIIQKCVVVSGPGFRVDG